MASALLQAVQDLRIGGRSSNALYQYTIQTDNMQDSTKWGPMLLSQMKRLPGLQLSINDMQKKLSVPSTLQGVFAGTLTYQQSLGTDPCFLSRVLISPRRLIAQANAQIGIAKAAYFPAIK